MAKLQKGTFTGQAGGHGGDIKVALTTDGEHITDVKIVEQHETPHVGDNAFKWIPERIVHYQSLAVDAVSGASFTSRGIINASKQALQAAGGDLADWSQPVPKPPVVAKDQTVDVAIAGGGLTGLTMAAFAIKNGLKPLIVEKNDQVGGSFRYAAGAFATVGSKKVADNQIDDLINWVKELNAHGAKKEMDYDFLRYLEEHTGETFDELVDIAGSKPQIAQEAPYKFAVFGGGAFIVNALEKYIKDHGGLILPDTVITKVNVDESGKHATGFAARNAAGCFTVTAKAVVIATGGESYGHKEDLVKTTPSLEKVHVFNEANPGNTGDGYGLLKEAGASFYEGNIYKNAFLDFGWPLRISYANVPDYSKAIVVNDQAKRFTNEAPFFALNLTTALYYEGSPRYYVIYDAAKMDQTFRKKLDAQKEDPKVVVHAGSVKELAEKLDLDPAALEQTVAGYNEACAKGEDEFGKDAAHLESLDGADGYYGLYTMPGSWGTIGGVKINRDMLVEQTDGSFFDNLYALGEMSTNELFSDFYIAGFSLANYSTEARLVAERLAAN